MKQCSKCKEVKNKDEFRKRKDSKDGLQGQCRECMKKHEGQYRKNNEERIRQQQKEWRRNNEEWIEQYQKEYYIENSDTIKEKVRKWEEKNEKYAKKRSCNYRKSPLKFISKAKVRRKIEKYEEIKESTNGNVKCKCAYCGGWFEPTTEQLRTRIRAIEGRHSEGSEARLYCSSGCKENCSIYGQELYPKDQKPATSREVQPELRKLVFERDNFTCQKCETHKNEAKEGIHCHHILPINESPVESADINNCITLCKECHNKVHQIPGCTYNELKCNKEVF